MSPQPLPRPSALGLALGVLVDALVGDPRRAHPVAGFGRLGARFEQRTYRDSRLAGAAHAATLVGAATVAVHTIDRSLPRRARVLFAAAVTATALGGTTLRRTARRLAGLLRAADLPGARRTLPSLCGRDPSSLDGTALARAGVESVAENTSDAVVGTLLWGVVLGPAGVVLHRTANTLDAMVGYRTTRYRRFGWAAARFDDLVNLIPARLTALLVVVCAPVVGGSPRDAWTVWRRDAATHPSPNAGQVEAAAAGALGIELGGAENRYGDQVERRPALGCGRPPGPADLDRAVRLSAAVSVVAAVAAVTVASARGARS